MIVKIAKTEQEIMDNLSIRFKVFVQEMNRAYEDEFDGLDELGILFIVYEDDKPVGASRILIEDSGFARFGKICVDKNYRNNHVGSMLIEAMESYIINYTPIINVYINGLLTVAPFYEHLGYSKDGEPFKEYNAMHIRLKKVLK